MPHLITPTIGRRVLYHPSAYDLHGDHADPLQAADPSQPLDAGVCYVWTDRMVNLTVADQNGHMHRRTSVQLVQDGDPVPEGGGYATWMPYQLAQAAAAAAPPLALTTVEVDEDGLVAGLKDTPAAPETETKTYADGTTVTGPGPLPDESPAQQDAAAASASQAAADTPAADTAAASASKKGRKSQSTT